MEVVGDEDKRAFSAEGFVFISFSCFSCSALREGGGNESIFVFYESLENNNNVPYKFQTKQG